jgi:ABC-type glutathione transport system ATPase component
VPHLSSEQRAAVTPATTRDDLALIVGRVGAGKTTAAATIAAAYREAGYEVRGAALAGKAADTLQQETLDHAARHDAKVILLGRSRPNQADRPRRRYRGLLEQQAAARLIKYGDLTRTHMCQSALC